MNLTEFLVLLFLIVSVGLSFSGVSEGFNSNKTIASELVYKVKNAYLNGVGTGSIGTGTAYQKVSNSCTIVHVQGNLPEPQAALERELGKKSACNCHCNSLFDCKCTGEKGCKNYFAYIVNPVSGEELMVGKLQKFRDGQYRISTKFTQDLSGFTKVVVRFDNEIPVLYGNFTDFR